MSDATLVAWVLVMLVGFGGSALCSGLETGTYAVNRVRLQIAVHRGRRGARTLRDELDHPPRLLTTLLIGNNLANYLGSAGVTVLIGLAAFDQWWQDVLVNVLIVTPVLFVFGETLPKDLFLAHADRLMPRFAGLLRGMRRVFTVVPLVPAIAGLTAVLRRFIGAPPEAGATHPRRRVGSLVSEGVGYGLITDEQTRIVQRVLDLGRLRVSDQMVPWARVVSLPRDARVRDVQRAARGTPFTRLPLVNTKGQCTEVVDVLSALRHADGSAPASMLAKPALALEPDLPIRAALSRMRQHGARVGVVRRTRGRPMGMVTLKDLVEPVTGEIASW